MKMKSSVRNRLVSSKIKGIKPKQEVLFDVELSLDTSLGQISAGLFVFEQGVTLKASKKDWNKNKKEYQERANWLMTWHYVFYQNIYNEEYVTSGSVLECTNGSKPITIQLPEDHGVIAENEKPLLTCKDCEAGTHIGSFGTCYCNPENYTRLTHHPSELSGEEQADGRGKYKCFPILGHDWITKNQNYMICVSNIEADFHAALDKGAVLICQYGGLITIAEVPDKSDDELPNEPMVPEEPEDDDCTEEGIPSEGSNGVYVVITKALNVREQPTADSASLLKVHVKDRINVIDSITNPKGELWAKIDLGDGRVGWVADRYILPDKPIETVFPETVVAYIDGEKKDLYPLDKWGQPGKGIYTGWPLMTEDGRYKIAIGPKVMNPKYPDDGKIEEEDFEAFDRNVELFLFNKIEQKEEKEPIRCYVEDWKAHSYNEYPVKGHKGKAPKVQVNVESGMFQTGIRYPYAYNKTEWAPKTFGGNIIEFCSDNTGDLNCEDYILRKVVVKLAEKE